MSNLTPLLNDIANRYAKLDKVLRGSSFTLSDAINSYAWIARKDGNASVLGMGHSGSADISKSTKDYISFVITTLEEDRDGDIVVPMGRMGKNYARNPLWFFGHQEWEIPIGTSRAKDGTIAVWSRPTEVISHFYPDKADEDAMFVFGKVQRGILNATSIAFVPLVAQRREGMHKAHRNESTPSGWQFDSWDHTETSIVGVPANAGAIRDAMDTEKRHISPRMHKALKPYAALSKKEQGIAWTGWCPNGNCAILKGKSMSKIVKKSCGCKSNKKVCGCKSVSKGKPYKSDYTVSRNTNKNKMAVGWWVMYGYEGIAGPFKTEAEAKLKKQQLDEKLAADWNKALSESSGTASGYTVPPCQCGGKADCPCGKKQALEHIKETRHKDTDMATKKSKPAKRIVSKKKPVHKAEIDEEVEIEKDDIEDVMPDDVEMDMEEVVEDVPFLPKASATTIAKTYQHAKAEVDFLEEELEKMDHPGISDSLAKYKAKYVDPRMEHLKDMLHSHHGTDGEDADTLMDKCMKGMSTDGTGGSETDPGEAGMVQAGEIPDEDEVFKGGRRKSVRKNWGVMNSKGQFLAPGLDRWVDSTQAKIFDNKNVAQRYAEQMGGTVFDFSFRAQKDLEKDFIGEEIVEDETKSVSESDGEYWVEYDDGTRRGPFMSHEDAVAAEGGMEDKDLDLVEWAEQEEAEPEHGGAAEEELIEEVAEDVEEEIAGISPDEDTEEILERYQHPKSKKWLTRKVGTLKRVNGKTFIVKDERSDYAQYAEYMRAQGITPISWEDWLKISPADRPGTKSLKKHAKDLEGEELVEEETKETEPDEIEEKDVVGEEIVEEETKDQKPPPPKIGDKFMDDGKQVEVAFVGQYDDYVGKWRVRVYKPGSHEEDRNWRFFSKDMDEPVDPEVLRRFKRLTKNLELNGFLSTN